MSQEAIKIRLSHELSDGEKQATEKRKVKVLQCLKHLGIACDENNMPNIAILGSGGGMRAMIALLGTLVEMTNQGLLDAAMYLCGVSGSTWSMSLLYNDKDWTENMQDLEERLCDALVKGEIEDFRNNFSTFKRSYPDDDIKQLLKKAKMNVSNNKKMILEEIQQIVSSSTKVF